MIYQLFIVLFVLKQAAGVIYRLNETVYNRLPSLYHLDDFYPCLQSPGDIYCFVDAKLVANTTSELLHLIQEYSANSRKHYDHTVVHRGLCVTHTCRQYVSNTTGLDHALEACLNATLYGTHRLQAKLIKDKVYCTRYGEKIEIDAGDCVVAAVLAVLLLLNVAGSVYARFDTKSGHIGARLLLCFSLQRNWERLTLPSGEGPDPRLQRLKCINGVKTMTSMCVILAHVPMVTLVNTNNPEYTETSYYNIVFSVVYNGTLLVQTFFLVSGFLLAYNILLVGEKTKVDWKMLPKGVILRWLRLTPPYAVVLAFVSTWLRHIGNGPFWKTDVESEIVYCRRYWFHNLLYFNNLVYSSLCMPHTWYLAADMQLSVLGLALFCLATSARARKIAVGAAIVLGLLTPALQVYVQNLDATIVVNPEEARKTFVTSQTFNSLYKRSHTNLICYVLGLALGMSVYHLQRINFDVSKYKKYRSLYWATVPLGLLLIMSGQVFYIDGLEMPLAFRMVYSSAVKTIYGLLFGVFLLGTVFKIENVYQRVVEWRGWSAPGRVAYCAYLCHICILRTGLASHTTLVQSSSYLLLLNIVGVLVFSFMVAVPLWMLVEAPCTQLVKAIFAR